MTHTSQVIDVLAGKELLLSEENSSDSQSFSESETAQFQKEAPLETSNDALKQFVLKTCKEMGMSPSCVIVYRDGVGDGQLDIVRETEVRQIRQALPHAKIVFCVVVKKMTEKFFVKVGNICGNPPQGTIIDELQRPERKGFYLISTETRLSTVRPTRYTFLEGHNVFPMDQLQSFTYSLCHLYPNWPDTIKLPLPTQLAHKLSGLVGQNLDESPNIHPNLFKYCYYL